MSDGKATTPKKKKVLKKKLKSSSSGVDAEMQNLTLQDTDEGNKQVEITSPHLERLKLGPRLGVKHTGTQFRLDEKRSKLREQITQMVQNLEKECFRIIFDLFPEKIQKLDQLYKEDERFNKKRGEVGQEVPTPDIPDKATKEEVQAVIRNVEVPPNTIVQDVLNCLQTEILEMSEMLNSLSIWVKLNVPRISDGNNFGVEVQEEIMAQLESAEASGYAIVDAFAAYHVSRGELVHQILQHPKIMDLRAALRELDEKQYLKGSLLACEMRNDYISLYDLMAKNLETITLPRGDEKETIMRMY